MTEDVDKEPILMFDDRHDDVLDSIDLSKVKKNSKLNLDHEQFILIGENPKAVMVSFNLEKIQSLLIETSSVMLDLIRAKDELSNDPDIMKVYTSLSEIVIKIEYNKRVISRLKSNMRRKDLR